MLTSPNAIDPFQSDFIFYAPILKRSEFTYYPFFYEALASPSLFRRLPRWMYNIFASGEMAHLFV
jgi:hypothetical protein